MPLFVLKLPVERQCLAKAALVLCVCLASVQFASRAVLRKEMKNFMYLVAGWQVAGQQGAYAARIINRGFRMGRGGLKVRSLPACPQHTASLLFNDVHPDTSMLHRYASQCACFVCVIPRHGGGRHRAWNWKELVQQ